MSPYTLLMKLGEDINSPIPPPLEDVEMITEDGFFMLTEDDLLMIVES